MGRSINNQDELGLEKVSSAGGFSAGDPIYETGSGIGIVPNGLVSTGSFEASGDLKLPGNGANANHGESKSIMIDGGHVGNGHWACKLSDGKWAIAYYKSADRSDVTTEDSFPYLRIYNEDNTVAVAEVQITSDTDFERKGGYSGSAISICQLSGGNLVIAWCGSNTTNQGGYPCWAVHNSSTGAQITAPQRYTAENVTYDKIILRPLTNGNFCFAFLSTSRMGFEGLYDSTGTVVHAFTSVGNSIGTDLLTNSFDVIARHDGNYVLVHGSGGNSSLYVRVYNGTTGIAITNSTPSLPSGGEPTAASLTMDSNNDISVWVANVGYFYHLKMASSGNVFGAATELYTNASFSGSGTTDGGTFSANEPTKVTAMCCDGTTNHIIYCAFRNGPSRFFFHDSDGVSVGTWLTANSQIIDGYCQGMSTVEFTDTVRFYFNEANSGDSTYYFRPTILPSAKNYYEITKTGFTLLGGSGVSGSLGTISAPVNAYTKAGSSVKGAAFLPPSSGATQSVSTGTTTSATAVESGELISGGTCLGYDVEPRQGGGFILVRQQNAGDKCIVYLYDKDYAQISETEVKSSGVLTSVYQQVSITQLGNGKIVVCYATSGSGVDNLKFKIYSADMQTLHVDETSFNRNFYTSGGDGYSFVIQALHVEAGDEWVIAGSSWSSGYAAWTNYSDDGTMKGLSWRDVSEGYLNSYHTINLQLCAMPGGDLVIGSTWTGYNTWYVKHFKRNSTGDHYYQRGIFSVSLSTYPGDRKRYTKCFTGFTGAYSLGWSNNSGEMNVREGTLISRSYYKNISPGGMYNYNRAWGVSGANGVMRRAYMNAYTSTGGDSLFIYNTMANNSENYTQFTFANVRAVNTGGYIYNNTAIPGTGNDMISFGCANNNDSKIYYQVNRICDELTNIGYSASTPSSQIDLDASSQRAAFLGVAVTDCAANEIGTIQTKGSVALSSSYKDETAGQAFDFNSRSTSGKAGTQAGRSVTLKE